MIAQRTERRQKPTDTAEPPAGARASCAAALTASAFATPAIIGGRRLKVVATTAYDEYLNTLNWPLGAAIALLLLLANVVVIMSYNRLIERRYAKVFE